MKARYDVYERLRDMKNMSDSDVASETGITKSTFSDWKSGRSNPGGGKIQRLVQYFGVDFSDFYSEDNIDIIFKGQRIITDSEFEIIEALREHPDMLPAIRKLLDIREKKDNSVSEAI